MVFTDPVVCDLETQMYLSEKTYDGVGDVRSSTIY